MRVASDPPLLLATKLRIASVLLAVVVSAGLSSASPAPVRRPQPLSVAERDYLITQLRYWLTEIQRTVDQPLEAGTDYADDAQLDVRRRALATFIERTLR